MKHLKRFNENITSDNKGINCTDNQTIKDFLNQGGNGSTVNIFVQSSYLVEAELYQPLKTDYSVYFNDLSDISRSKDTYFFQQMNIKDDKGIILPQLNYSSTFSLQKQTLQNEVIGNDTPQKIMMHQLSILL